MKRVLSITFLAVVALALVSAQTTDVKPPEKRSFKHGTKIFQEYIALADKTLVKSKNIRVMRDKIGPIEMSAEFASPGQHIVTPDSILLMFISPAKSQRYDASTMLTLVVDGEDVPFSTTNRVLFIYGGGFVETMLTPVPYKTFLRVANSHNVHVKLGPTEFTLDEKAMEVLRDVASRTGSSLVPPGTRPNKSLDRSGGSVFRIKPGAAKVALIRAARSTLTLGGYI